MRFVRKLSKRNEFGSMCIPKSFIDSWKNVNYLEILFDGGSMVITPYLEG